MSEKEREREKREKGEKVKGERKLSTRRLKKLLRKRRNQSLRERGSIGIVDAGARRGVLTAAAQAAAARSFFVAFVVVRRRRRQRQQQLNSTHVSTLFPFPPPPPPKKKKNKTKPVSAMLGASNSSDPFSWERKLLAAAKDAGATPLLLLNMKRKKGDPDDADAAFALLRDAAHAARDALDPEHSVISLEIDLVSSSAAQGSQQAVTNRLSEAIAAAIASRGGPALPPPALPLKYLSRDAAVLLVIPMDAETPGGRLLRPQALVQEELLRAYARVVAVRLDLGAARGERGVDAQRVERERFDEALASMMMVMGGKGGDGSTSDLPPPRLVVTDSQAIDVVHEWTLSGERGEGREGKGEEGGGGESRSDDERAAADGESSSSRKTHHHRRCAPLVDVTTFSIAMAARQSGGAEQLALMVEGIAAARRLREVKRFVCFFFF